MDLRGSSVLFSRVKSARIDTICRGTLLTTLRDGHHLGMSERTELARRGRWLEYFTIGWNSLEGLIAVAAGAFAGSISLVGFGVDSFIEVTSGAALLWRMSGDADHCQRERREAITLRIVGLCFLGLAAYIAVEAIGNLRAGTPATTSGVGIG